MWWSSQTSKIAISRLSLVFDFDVCSLRCGFSKFCVHQAPRSAWLQVRVLRVLRLHVHGHPQAPGTQACRQSFGCVWSMLHGVQARASAGGFFAIAVEKCSNEKLLMHCLMNWMDILWWFLFIALPSVHQLCHLLHLVCDSFDCHLGLKAIKISPIYCRACCCVKLPNLTLVFSAQFAFLLVCWCMRANVVLHLLSSVPS